MINVHFGKRKIVGLNVGFGIIEQQRPVRIGIVGSRRRDSSKDKEKVVVALDQYLETHNIGNYILVSGGCPDGADRFAKDIAIERGLTILIHYPDWETHGKVGGIIRNTKIANDCDVLIACVATDRKGGTENTIRKVKKLNKPIILVK